MHNSWFRLSIFIIAFVLLSWFMREFADILIPVVLGGVLGLIFTPLLFFLKKKRMPNVVVILIILALFLIVSLIFISLMTSALYNIGNNFTQYQSQGLLIIQALTSLLPNLLDETIMVEIQTSISNYFQSNIFSYSRTFLQSFFQISTKYMIAMFTMIFVLIERLFFHKKILQFFNADVTESRKVSNMILNINLQVSKFLVLKTMISFATGILIYVGFTAIGVDFPFLWALLTFLFNFIPTVGSIIITLISILFSILQFFPNYTPVLLVVILTGSTQMIVGNFLDPKIMGDRLNLSPLVIWLSLLYWGVIWGVVGALLAVPLGVIIKMICDFVPSLRPVGLFMGNSKLIHNVHRSHTELPDDVLEQSTVGNDEDSSKNKKVDSLVQDLYESELSKTHREDGKNNE